MPHYGPCGHLTTVHPHATGYAPGAHPVTGDSPAGFLVPAGALRVRPRPARGAVPPLDVAEAPLDLGRRVRLPVRRDRGHLAARQGLRDAVRAAAGVGGVRVPAALPLEQLVQ